MAQVLTAVLLLSLAQQRDDEVGTGPEPSPVRVAWEIDFDFSDLRRIEIQLPGGSKPKIYWYMLYTATNTSERTQRFFPTLELVTEDLQVLEPNIGISPIVFNAIKERHKKTHPYLTDPTRVIGDLLIGDDNARESVAIWRQFDPNVNSFSVFVAGLSGENRTVRNPAYDPSKPESKKVMGPEGIERNVPVNPKNFTLRKTLEIRYTLPGAARMRRFVEPQRTGTRWIMR